MAQSAAAAEPGPVLTIEPGPVLTIVVPTFNERDNVAELTRRLNMTLSGVEWEVVFVDDNSPDGTGEAIHALGRADRRVRCLRRIGRRGLSSACMEGMLSSGAPFLAVMDGDLQHDESLLKPMLALLEADDADLVIGSRYVVPGSVEGWGARRRRISRLATRLSGLVMPIEIADPMSGFFMLRREVFESAMRRVSGVGFKILLDLLASSDRPLRLRELPYRFRNRSAGTSKLDTRVGIDFLLLVIDKRVGRWVPARLVLFGAVGGTGTLVHLAILSAVYRGLDAGFVVSQALATLAAMVFNFALNNELTYRDQRLRGRGWIRGCFSFVLACSIGAVANVGVAGALYSGHTNWLLSAAAGIVVGTVWNYTATAFYTWRTR